MANEDYRSGDPFVMKGEGLPVESLNNFILTGGLFLGHGGVEVPEHFKNGVWNSQETPQKARFCKFTLQNMTGTNNGQTLQFNTGEGCVIKAEIFLQMLEKVEKIQFNGTGLEGLQVNVLKNYPSGAGGDVIIEYLDLNNPSVNILASQLENDSFYLELIAEASNITVESIGLTVKTSRFGEGEDIGLSTDHVVNDSTVVGVDATDAFNELKSKVEALTSLMETRKHQIGTILPTTSSVNPATQLGYGTWERYAQGKVLVGEGGGFAAGATGGNKEITLSVNQLPSHKHNVAVTSSGGSTSGASAPNTNSSGGSTSGSSGILYTSSSDPYRTGFSSPKTNTTGAHTHAISRQHDAEYGGGSQPRPHSAGADTTQRTSSDGAHSHTVNDHDHAIGPHGHKIDPHSHSTPNHSHTVASHTHATPNHTHTVTENNVGSAAPVNIMPPYVVVYMWRRTA